MQRLKHQKLKPQPLNEYIIETVFKKGWDSVAWIHLAEDKDQRRDLVNRSVANVRYPYKV
jgi:hypothetical protein